MATSSNNDDPSNLLSKTVKIQNTSRNDLNNQLGMAISYLPPQNRYIIQLSPPVVIPGTSSSSSHRTVSLKPENLIAATYTERIRFTLEEMKRAATTLYHDPQTRVMLQRVYTEVDGRLPSNIRPEHALGGLVLVLFLLVRVLGFTRLVFLGSVLAMVGGVALPDLMAGGGGGGYRTAVRNFPVRWRSMLVEQTGFGWISHKMAMGSLVLLLLLTGNVLFPGLVGSKGRGGRGGGGVGDKYDSSTVEPLVTETTTTTTTTHMWTMEEVYKLGFEDGVRSTTTNPDEQEEEEEEEEDSNGYGRSLPKDHTTMGYFTPSDRRHQQQRRRTAPFTDEFDREDEEWDNDYPMSSSSSPVPPPPKKSGFGIGTVLSLFAIGRTVKELGFVGGRFEPSVLVENVKMMEPWRLGLMGLAVYRVVSAFL